MSAFFLRFFSPSFFAAKNPVINGTALQNEIRELFAQAGFPTEIQNGRWRGFFHGLGHGLGLEIHESPRVATPSFQQGVVITVEPGIYWHAWEGSVMKMSSF